MSQDLQLFAVQQAAQIAAGLFYLAAAVCALATALLAGVLLLAWRTR